MSALAEEGLSGSSFLAVGAIGVLTFRPLAGYSRKGACRIGHPEDWENYGAEHGFVLEDGSVQFDAASPAVSWFDRYLKQYDSGRKMASDEQAIRAALDTFIKASETGDLQAAKSVIAEDAVFLVPHAGTMDRESYATAATAKPEGDENIEFDLKVDIKEIKIMGDHAYVWLATTLTITPESGDATQWAGHTLSILQKRNGAWLVVRDANTLLPVQQ